MSRQLVTLSNNPMDQDGAFLTRLFTTLVSSFGLTFTCLLHNKNELSNNDSKRSNNIFYDLILNRKLQLFFTWEH